MHCSKVLQFSFCQEKMFRGFENQFIFNLVNIQQFKNLSKRTFNRLQCVHNKLSHAKETHVCSRNHNDTKQSFAALNTCSKV